MSGCDSELNAHFYSAASLKYHVPDIWHDTTPSHIILTLGRPVLALPRKSECQASTIFYDFGMSRLGIEPVTSRSPERTFYQLSYRGRFDAFVCDIYGSNYLDRTLVMSWISILSLRFLVFCTYNSVFRTLKSQEKCINIRSMETLFSVRHFIRTT